MLLKGIWSLGGAAHTEWGRTTDYVYSFTESPATYTISSVVHNSATSEIPYSYILTLN